MTAAELRRDTRPVVGRDRDNAPLWLFAAALIVLAIGLFAVLEGRRERLAAPSVRAARQDLVTTLTAPPPLIIPAMRETGSPPIVPKLAASPQPIVPPPPSRQRDAVPVFEPQPSIAVAPPVAASVPVEKSPVLVIDDGSPVTSRTSSESAEAAASAPSAAIPARAGRLRRRETTIVQGSLIPAVLETALNSTRPGQARALVSQDVHGYGGRYVLIPRGSRLFGEYRADIAPGQNRALVQWTRLDRPDGATIALNSPAADALGRAGIRGRVNSHFFERFGSAILQSTLDLGVSVASRSVGSSPVIVALPTGASATQGIAQPPPVQPTITVKQGARISVFVARDLDFTAVERRR